MFPNGILLRLSKRTNPKLRAAWPLNTNMFTTLLPTLLLLLPVALASPLTTPRTTAALGAITQFVYSGSGCTQGSNSVSISPTSNGYTTQVYTFNQFATSDTQNCELHFQGSGLSPGWQVSLAELDVVGSTRGAVSAVRWFWQVYWSDDAADTVWFPLLSLCLLFCLPPG